MKLYNFKEIEVVPKSKDFIDVVLSKTQRKTPTVVHKGYQITRIRAFYMRKVKFTQKNIHDKLTGVLEAFPRLDDIHPFYAELLNVLYDRDHYKAALGRLNTCRHYIDQLGREYVRLMKYGDSLYRCKQLKRAALGRMATLLKKLDDSLGYLEQVRQHLSRLPSVDPNTRTLLICGFPNVGKTSFLNSVTRADGDVQNYEFTTKSLFVGHTDYRFMKWQVIDTPGILDKPPSQLSTIEMQSITALAHLKATVMYFMDLSCNCGYSIDQQINLFRNISPLFSQKPLLVVLNKADVIPFADIDPADQQTVKSAVAEAGAQMVECSTLHDMGVGDLKSKACELLLAHRQETKVRGKKFNDIENRIYCAVPDQRDEKARPAVVPPSVLRQRQMKAEGVELPKRTLEKDLEMEGGGPGVYSHDLRKHYMLDNDEWNYDIMPEFINGKNVRDWIDPDIEQRLAELEAEEDARLEELAAQEDAKPFELNEVNKEILEEIREKVALMKQANIDKRTTTRGKLGKVQEAVERHQALIHKDREHVEGEKTRGRKRKRAEDDEEDEYAARVERSESRGSGLDLQDRSRSRSTIRSTSRTRFFSNAPASRDRGVSMSKLGGLKSGSQQLRAFAMAKKKTRTLARDSRMGESDRHHYDLKPKWAFSGKMKTNAKRHAR